MQRVLKIYYLCKVLIIFFVALSPKEVYPKNYEKVYKNFYNAKLIDSKEYLNKDIFLIKNSHEKFLTRSKQTKGRNFVRFNQLLIFIILLIIFISVNKG